jgi:hypothetical protein
MLHLERRELMVTVVSVAAFATLPTSTARSQSALDLAQLSELVQSQRERALLVLHMYLTIDALQLFIFSHNVFETFEDFSKIEENWEQSRNDFLSWLDRFYTGEFSEQLSTALATDDAGALIEGAAQGAENLVGEVAGAFREIGIPPDGGTGSEALVGIMTVEQLKALQSNNVPSRSTFCEIFPFSYFCRE